MIVIKLGGSFITDKSKYRTFRRKETERALSEIVNLHQKFALIHGAGSYGHILCKENGFPGPFEDKEVQVSRVKRDTDSLNSEIISILIEMGISCLSFSPFDLRRKGTFDYTPVLKAIESGFVPVLYGDIYLDSREVKIYSGDSIMFDLCNLLNPESAVFMGDVDGVFDGDPKRIPGSSLLRTVEVEQSFLEPENDVTGGMGGKFKTMKRISALGVRTYMMNGFFPERIREIGTDKFYGSVIK
ncbi:MAG: isopentenyl phosphate kinase [Thermoplasmataceae archaeon]